MLILAVLLMLDECKFVGKLPNIYIQNPIPERDPESLIYIL